MKKFLITLLVILLIVLTAVVVYETPIVVNTKKREEAIEILNKVFEYNNYQVTKNYAAGGIAYAEKEMTKKDYATVIERYHDRECVSIDWISNEYNNLAYYFDVSKKECYPEYTTDREYTTVLPNESVIYLLKDSLIKDLKITNIEYDGIEALEIKFTKTGDNVVVDKTTGFVLTEYNENGGVNTTYTYNLGKIINNHVIPKFEGYTISIEMDQVEWKKSMVLNVTGDNNLPEEFRNTFRDTYKDLFDSLDIKSKDN